MIVTRQSRIWKARLPARKRQGRNRELSSNKGLPPSPPPSHPFFSLILFNAGGVARGAGRLSQVALLTQPAPDETKHLSWVYYVLPVLKYTTCCCHMYTTRTTSALAVLGYYECRATLAASWEFYITNTNTPGCYTCGCAFG